MAGSVPAIPTSVQTCYEWSHFQTSHHCDVAEVDEVNDLLKALEGTSEQLCANLPTLCQELARKTKQPLTEQVALDAEASTLESYKCLSQRTVEKVGNALV